MSEHSPGTDNDEFWRLAHEAPEMLALLKGWLEDFDAGWALDEARSLARLTRALLARLDGKV